MSLAFPMGQPPPAVTFILEIRFIRSPVPGGPFNYFKSRQKAQKSQNKSFFVPFVPFCGRGFFDLLQFSGFSFQQYALSALVG
jgi:hypothetical protein